MTMSWDEIAPKANDLLDGRLSEEEARDVRRIISEDADCARRFRELESLKAGLRRLGAEKSPSDIAERVLGRLEQQGSSPSSTPSLHLVKRYAALAAAVLAAIVVGMLVTDSVQLDRWANPPAAEMAAAEPESEFEAGTRLDQDEVVAEKAVSDLLATPKKTRGAVEKEKGGYELKGVNQEQELLEQLGYTDSQPQLAEESDEELESVIVVGGVGGVGEHPRVIAQIVAAADGSVLAAAFGAELSGAGQKTARQHQEVKGPGGKDRARRQSEKSKGGVRYRNRDGGAEKLLSFAFLKEASSNEDGDNRAASPEWASLLEGITGERLSAEEYADLYPDSLQRFIQSILENPDVDYRVISLSQEQLATLEKKAAEAGYVMGDGAADGNVSIVSSEKSSIGLFQLLNESSGATAESAGAEDTRRTGATEVEVVLLLWFEK